MDGKNLTATHTLKRIETGLPSVFGDVAELSVGVALRAGGSSAAAHWPWRGLAVAIVAHGALLAALIWRPTSDTMSGGVVLDAIEVSVIDGRALDALTAAARTDGQMQPAAASLSTEAPATPGAQAQADAAPKPEDEKPLAVVAVPDSVLQVPAGPPDVPTERRESEPQTLTPPAPPQIETASAADGGVSRGADTAVTAEPAAARASPGMVQEYAVSVAKVLARNKPDAPGPKGTARVRFVVGRDGLVAEASVLKSSGSAALDAAALSAVRRSRFPAPPVILTQADTTFDLPFHFR